MESTSNTIIALLKTYPGKKRQIELLRFELEHPSRIGEQEMIEGLSFGIHQGEMTRNLGHISNRTMTIALQYQENLQRMNCETIAEIMQELRDLETEVSRLECYVSMLDEPQATTIRLLYFEQKSWAEAEKKMSISKRTLMNYRKNAIDELAAMYSYLDKLIGKVPEESSFI